nr:hypothetical protein [Tanacetum cinerariifolium]
RQRRPQQCGEQERRRDRLVLLHAQVGVGQGLADQCVRVGRGVLQRLGARREQRFEQFQVNQHLERWLGIAIEEQLEHFFEQARRWNITQHRRQRSNRRRTVLLDAEIKLGGETHSAQHSHRVFFIALLRIANQPDETIADVVYAVGEIEHAFGDRVVIQGVDGEVATLCVFFQRAFETTTDDAGITEFGTDLLRRGAGGDVEVFRRDAQHHVAYAAADQIGLVAGILQAFDDAHRVAAELIALQRMLAAAEHFRRCTHVLLRFAQRRTE